jgi:nucleoside-diphosphate-sugar epimerase
MNVLITGGLGFIGSGIVRECLNRGHSVFILSRSTDKLPNIDNLPDDVTYIIKDVCDIGVMDVAGKDWIFHCASTVDNYNILDNPTLDTHVNCLGTLALLEACRKYNPHARIVFPSTFFVNGNLDQLPATPESPCNPLGLYGTTKLAAEHFCRIYRNVFGLDTVVARLTNVFGVREQWDNNKKAAFNRMIWLAVNGEPISLYGNGDTRRDYVYVDDAARALVLLAERGNPEQVYYIGGGVGIKIGALAEVIIEEVGSGRIVNVDTPDFHKSTGMADFWCNNGPMLALGWKPEVSIREGIRRVIAEYRSQ